MLVFLLFHTVTTNNHKLLLDGTDFFFFFFTATTCPMMPRAWDEQMEHRADQPLWQLSFKSAKWETSAPSSATLNRHELSEHVSLTASCFFHTQFRCRPVALLLVSLTVQTWCMRGYSSSTAGWDSSSSCSSVGGSVQKVVRFLTSSRTLNL